MHKKDYLQRRLEEFGKVLALILKFKKDNDLENFEKEIAEAVKKFTALEITAVEKMSDAEFEKDLLLSSSLSQEQKKILATLLFEKLSVYLTSNDAGNYEALKIKCKNLYQHLQDNFTDNEFDLDVYYKLGFLNKL